MGKAYGCHPEPEDYTNLSTVISRRLRGLGQRSEWLTCLTNLAIPCSRIRLLPSVHYPSAAKANTTQYFPYSSSASLCENTNNPSTFSVINAYAKFKKLMSKCLSSPRITPLTCHTASGVCIDRGSHEFSSVQGLLPEKSTSFPPTRRPVLLLLIKRPKIGKEYCGGGLYLRSTPRLSSLN